MKMPGKTILKQVYGESVQSMARFARLAEGYRENFKREQAAFFSAPGRTEMIGNHTDHNGGKVIAASIDLDTIGAAWPNDSTEIRIVSEGYGETVVELTALADVEKVSGTKALLAGIAEGTRHFGYKVSGFDAYLSTNVISAAGVSSSASMEMLICAMVNAFFNEGAMSCADYAKIGQYAENVYWKKASGQMDQMACAVGGAVLLNFADKNAVEYKKTSLDLDRFGYQMVIVNTGKGHADLSGDYSAVPQEMNEVARALGVNRLCETTEDALLANLPELNNDRALLRAFHFFEENKRVEAAAAAIEAQDRNTLLALLDASGKSSWEWLQNCYTTTGWQDQKITLALALTALFLQKAGAGICRVHGGGFAGVIQCVLPQSLVADYCAYIARYVGEKNIYPVQVRATGAVCLSD